MFRRKPTAMDPAYRALLDAYTQVAATAGPSGAELRSWWDAKSWPFERIPGGDLAWTRDAYLMAGDCRSAASALFMGARNFLGSAGFEERRVWFQEHDGYWGAVQSIAKTYGAGLMLEGDPVAISDVDTVEAMKATLGAEWHASRASGHH